MDYGKNIKLYYPENCIKSIVKDIDSAKNRIVLSIPDASFVGETSNEILKALNIRREYGIDVLIKTTDFEKMSDGWKKIAWASDNAVFPLLIIDNSVIWYGVPVSEGRFVDGNSSFRTVCPTIFRITGSKTIEMIKSLTEYDQRIVDGRKSILKPKSGYHLDDEKGKGDSGLAEFIGYNEFCKYCGTPMKLTRGRSGKPFIMCPSCKKTALLTDQLVNKYISYERVKCPKCRNELIARVSPNAGLYIKCSNGHFIKPEEI